MKTLVASLLFMAVCSSFVSPHRALKKKLFCNRNASFVSYDGKHPFHKWTAVNKDIICVITFDEDKRLIETVAASTKVMSFDSRNTNRDSHGLEMIEALTFPKVNFTSASIQERENTMTINGSLNFHGVTKNIIVEAKSIIEANRITIDGSFPIKLQDYKISPPSLLFVKIEDEIKVNFHFVFGIQ